MQLINILNMPSYFQKRRPSLNYIPLDDVNYQFIDNKYVITADAISSDGKSKYHLTLIIEDVTINANSKIRVDCDCPSFKYEFAYAVGQNDGLIYNKDYISKRPKKRNIYSHVTGCKHLVRLGQLIFRRKNLIKPVETKIEIKDDMVVKKQDLDQFDWL